MYYKSLAAIFSTLLLGLSLSSLPEVVLAQELNPARSGLPGRRVGGGTRGNCNFGAKMLTALVPKNNLASTVAANPQLFFYIPQTSKSQELEFVLLDENDNQVYEKKFITTGKAGIISINLPESPQLKGLKIGNKYHWYLSVICNAADRASDISVDGWIQRVTPNPNLTSKLRNLAPLQLAHEYAEAGLWQEALTTLAQLRYSRPHDSTLAAEWTKFLHSADLDSIAQEPLVQCCTPKTIQ